MKKLFSFLTLFTSMGTLICCALPALFVALGMGAALVGLIGNVPQLVWFSENKIWIFAIGGVLLGIGGFNHFKNASCPVNSPLSKSCQTTKDWSKPLYFLSLGIYAMGAFFAFAAPYLFNS